MFVLKARAKEINITQAEIASILGVTHQHVSLLMRGERYPSLVLVPKLARCLKLNPLELFDIYVKVIEESAHATTN